MSVASLPRNPSLVTSTSTPAPPAALPAQAPEAPTPAADPVSESRFKALTSSPFSSTAGLRPRPEASDPTPELSRPAADPDALAALRPLPNFASLAPEQQAKACEIFPKLDPDGRSHLADLVNRTMPGGKPALLDTDSQGGTLLDSLHKIATGPLAPEFLANGVTRYSLLSSIAQEAATPGEINQSHRGTCTVTSMQYMLSKKNPAEYVRLMQGLISPGGTAPLRNGEALTRVPDSIAPDDATTRSASERLFQSAMMDYCNGSEVYKNLDDLKTGGLDTDESQERGLNALFGGTFRACSFRHATPDEEKATHDAWEELSADERNEWRQKSNAAPSMMLPEEFYAREQLMQKLRELPSEGALAGISYGRFDTSAGHDVVIEKLENDRIYFRNPWGARDQPNGTVLFKTPDCRLEDNKTGLESMSCEDFFKFCGRKLYLSA
jgi:hypothetical protein